MDSRRTVEDEAFVSNLAGCLEHTILGAEIDPAKTHTIVFTRLFELSGDNRSPDAFTRFS